MLESSNGLNKFDLKKERENLVQKVLVPAVSAEIKFSH